MAVYLDPQMLQAVSSVVIAVFTAVLILVTVSYTKAAKRSSKIMEQDLALRALPIVEGHVRFDTVNLTVRRIGLVTVTATHSPVELARIILNVKDLFGKNHDIEMLETGTFHIIATDRQAEFSQEIGLDYEPEEWILILRYHGMANKDLYETRVNPDGKTEMRIVQKAKS
jgi:hypothetical protein